MRFVLTVAFGAAAFIGPALARTTTSQVNFEYGRSEIVSWSASGISTASAAARACSNLRAVRVTGHTDARESAEAINEGLDELRSEATRDALTAQGVSPDRILLREVGAMQPAFPSASGVSDPRNRRATIEVVCN
ncbi:MAG: OmpA family protein [Hyphomonadaceae bacterium]|nr:OmpA family protein [Hyphomonadaceae bacterium]